MLTHSAPTMVTLPAQASTSGDAQWPVVDDPSRWRRFVLQVIDAHHRVTVPGVGTDQCSCGRPFMLCPIGPLAHQLLG